MLHKLSFSVRAKKSENELVRKLCLLTEEKKSNLIVAADVETSADLLRLADEIGPEICVLKTHVDIVKDMNEKVLDKLQLLAKQHNFLLFEDRKFADIGNTVKAQYQGGIYRIVEWAHLINAHPLPGPGLIQGLKEIGLPRGRGLLLLAEMSTEGNLITPVYREKTLKMAQENKDFVVGLLARDHQNQDPTLLNFTTGVHSSEKGDNLGQHYLTVEEAIQQKGADFVIVGRGVYTHAQPATMARHYKVQAFNAYQVCCR
jgi:orotidine 5'-phosphate decarboxylase subfamily 1